MKPCKRGHLYYANLDPTVGSEQAGYRPVLIIQNNTGNRHSPTVIVASVTSKGKLKANLPTHCYINRIGSCKQPSVVMLEQIRTIDKSRLENYIGKVNKDTMRKIDQALAVSVGLTDIYSTEKEESYV